MDAPLISQSSNICEAPVVCKTLYKIHLGAYSLIRDDREYTLENITEA